MKTYWLLGERKNGQESGGATSVLPLQSPENGSNRLSSNISEVQNHCGNSNPNASDVINAQGMTNENKDIPNSVVVHGSNSNINASITSSNQDFHDISSSSPLLNENYSASKRNYSHAESTTA